MKKFPTPESPHMISSIVSSWNSSISGCCLFLPLFRVPLGKAGITTSLAGIGFQQVLKRFTDLVPKVIKTLYSCGEQVRTVFPQTRIHPVIAGCDCLCARLSSQLIKALRSQWKQVVLFPIRFKHPLGRNLLRLRQILHIPDSPGNLLCCMVKITAVQIIPCNKELQQAVFWKIRKPGKLGKIQLRKQKEQPARVVVLGRFFPGRDIIGRFCSARSRDAPC